MKLFIGLFLAICVITLGIFLLTPSTQGQKKYNDEPTIVQKGQVTEKERAYSKEYNELYSYRKGRKFTEMIEESNGIGDTTGELGASVGGHEAFFLPGAPEITPDEFFNRLSCKADLIVLGSANNKLSHMTDDETFIYTAYEFLVQDILKNKPDSPVKSGSTTIDVTRPGGLISLDSRRIRIVDLSYEPLQPGRTYLLFLKYIPAAGGYMPADPSGDFALESGSFIKFSKRPVPKELQGKIRSKDLLNAIRRANLNFLDFGKLGTILHADR